MLLAHRAGAIVSGCDAGGPSPYTAALDAAGIHLDWQHDPAHVDRPASERPERLAVTKALTAVNPDHPELLAARRLGIPTEPWQQVDRRRRRHHRPKPRRRCRHARQVDTAGWLVDLLVRAGRDPSAFVGALLDETLTGATPSTARWGSGDVFVVEADEYAGNFDPYKPDVIALLNAEWDHPDVFADADAVYDAFARLDPRSRQTRRSSPSRAIPASRGAERLADWSGQVVELDDATLPYQIGLPGPANAANARMVAVVARMLGRSERSTLRAQPVRVPRRRPAARAQGRNRWRGRAR